MLKVRPNPEAVQQYVFTDLSRGFDSHTRAMHGFMGLAGSVTGFRVGRN